MRITLGQVKWTHLLDMDVDNCWNYIKSQIHGVMSKYIPTTTKKKNLNYTPRWMTKSIKRIIKKKYVFYKKYLQARSVNNYNKYLHVRNEANKLIRKAKRNHERILAEESKCNPKKFWKYVTSNVKNVSGISTLIDERGLLAVTNKEKANTLNAFFSSVFIKENLNDEPMTSIGEKSRYIYTGEIRVTPDAILQRINKLNRGKAQGPDEIPPRVIYELGRELSVPLSILFNKSLELGKIPLEWKNANVVAIFKKGTKSNPGNYRPVSLTCVTCKILESVIRDAIVEHMNDYNLYSDCQHGFRKRRSCVTQLLHVMEDLSLLVENGCDIDVIYFDFRKAFDQVPHQRLLSKLASYGIAGNILQWIADFLSNRCQTVRVGNCYSSKADVLSGIPQGSILGPILFTLFINDLPENISSRCKIFADDTKLYGAANSSDILQNDIKSLQRWSARWQLYFNVDKCKVLHIGIRNPQMDYSMTNGNITFNIAKCESEKDLGVIFDSKLTFDNHIETIIKKANKMIGIIKRTFSYLNRASFIQLYKALVRPHLEYGNIIWFPHLKRQSSTIEKVQRRATRLLFEPRSLNYEERMRHLCLPSLKYRRLRGDMIQVFKLINGLDDLDWKDFFTKSRTDITRLSQYNLFITYSRTNTRKFAFGNRAAPMWNKLSETTRSVDTLNKFKNMLDKDPFFQQYTYDYDA